MQRKIAFCVGTWSAESTLFSWTFAKQYFLRKQRNEDGAETLSGLDQLHIVHVIQNKGKERWDAGGPILPRLSTALENYPHTVQELEGRDTANAIIEYAKREDIDILILGSREGKGAVQKMVPGSAVGSISEAVKIRSSIPCLIIRPSSARNEKMRIKSMGNMEQLLEGANLSPGQSLPGAMKATVITAQAPPIPRKSPLVKMQKSASFQKAMLNKKPSEPPLEDGSVEDVGKEELQGYEEPLRTRLKGDAKAELCDYLVEKGIDLLIVGYSAANRFKKAFAGGSLSTHMMQHAQCPVVVIPLKSMSWEDQDTLGQLPEHRQSLGGIDRQPSQAGSDADGHSPPPLHSLGPRVSMSRTLSHQMSQNRLSNDGQFGRHGNDGQAVSPTQSLPMGDRQRASFTGSHREQRNSVPMSMINERRPSASGIASVDRPMLSIPPPQQSRPLVPSTSPFEASTIQSQNSSESMDSQGHAARRARFAQGANSGLPGSPENVIDQLRRQLLAKDVEVAQLQAELRSMRFQMAALQGSSSPGRVTFE